jgi:uncharacterized protein YecT (DUF1311 family)
MFLTRLFFALACSTFAGAAYANSDCHTAESHVGQRICLEGIASASQDELKKTHDSLVKRIREWDDEPDCAQKSLQLLEQSFVAFERFRDAECEYEAAAAAGGNGAGDMRLQCSISLNRKYNEILRTQMNWYTQPNRRD